MRILVHGNGPNVSTGYGVQCRQLVEHLHRAGHQVAISATYGQQGSLGSWQIPTLERTPENRVRIYPCGYETNGNDIIHNHATHWFEGDEASGWIITLLDVWSIQNPLLKEYNVAAWCPVDHEPVPPGVLEFFRRTGATPIAMSEFGEKELRAAGLNPTYIPLAVDTRVMKPTLAAEAMDGHHATGREIMGVPDESFIVGMVGMNKGWARDRKGFNEALQSFGLFWREHQDVNPILYMHCDAPGGAEGIDLRRLATYAGIPEHAIKWVNQYAYRLGLPQDMLAAIYTSMDVLLAPSHGEGFCVPLIEAQACGTPVIASNFSAQPELVKAGWLVRGQREWDPAQQAWYFTPFIFDIVTALEEALKLSRDEKKSAQAALEAVDFAAQFDSRKVFAEHWQPFLKSLEPVAPPPPSYEREPMGEVAVIVPFMRHDNLSRLVHSFQETTDSDDAHLYLILDNPNSGMRWPPGIIGVTTDLEHTTFAEKVNVGVDASVEPWLLIVGDDVEFKPGWLEAARKLSTEYDVIGTNDSSNGVKNPEVAAGRHADHFFVRRAYVDAEGACLDGPGVLAPEAYKHWYTDKEIIELAKARRVFTPCLESVIEHHHPGYDGREDLREADPVYMKAVEHRDKDEETFRSRLPYIYQHRVGAAK